MRRTGIRRAAAGVAWATCTALVAWAGPASEAAAQQVDRTLDTGSVANAEAAKSQGRIDKLSDQTQDLLQDYRGVNRQIETLQVYNKQLSDLVASQEEEKAGMQRQIEEVSQIEREIRPLMAEMVESLEQFVELDVPFLLDERRTRVARLRDLLSRSDVSVSEVYRRIMEAWQIENDYGRAVDTYRATLETDGVSREVDFLNVGRVAFLYLTLDGKRAGVWDREQRKWVAADEYRDAVRKGLRMANKQAAFDLLTLPMPAATSAAGATSSGAAR